MGQEISECLNELNIEFSASNASRLLRESGVINSGEIGRKERLSKLVFLHSDKDEIYSGQEMQFIEQVGDIYIFPEFLKEMSRGNMTCRYICADLSWLENDIHTAVFFMKIIIKALAGFTIFILKLSDGIHIGIRTFEKKEYKNCTICENERVEEVLEMLLWQNADNFLDYYTGIAENVSPMEPLDYDYDEKVIRRRGLQYSYIEGLRNIESLYHVDLSHEIDRYFDWFEERIETSYKEEIEEVLFELKNIKSSKVNTLEMLFEADELEKLSIEADERYDISFESSDNENEVDIEMIEEYGDNPEEMIKKLKMKHGLL